MTKPLRIYVMGSVAIEHSHGLIGQEAFPGRQGLLAFARLLLTREAAVSRSELAEVLWPEEMPRAWDSALNAIVSKLRLLLRHAGLDKTEALGTALGCHQLNLPANTWVDIEVGTDSLHEAEGLFARGRYREAWSAAQVAYHILKRPFLAGETSSEWALRQRERLAGVCARAGECLAKIYIWNGEPAVAADVAEQVIAAAPLRETAYQELMRAHVAAGNRAEALNVYERCRKTLSQHLGVSPSAETIATHAEILKRGK
ncbi:MAG TPA: bacterial transcriptional activator domain-containing protein [Steroidobacteraceae bacterium]|nr:bacterial transcriptional activator domain-containing protein [Steroidobacteraceae bacterium]